MRRTKFHLSGGFPATLVCLAVSLVFLFGCSGGGTGNPAAPTLKAPTANVAGPYTGLAGTAVSFNGSASSDPQGQALSFSWSFGDGTTGTGASPTHAYATAGTYTISLVVTDTSGVASPAATTTASITPAADFSLNASPQSLSLAGGTSTTLNVTAGALNGFSGPVTVTVSGLPAGVTQTSTSYILTPGVPLLVQLRATTAVASAIMPFTVTATSGSLTHTAQVTLTTGTAADYSITTSTPALSIVPGSTQMMTVTATAVNGFTGAVMGSLSGLPPGVSASPASFALPLGTAVPVTVTAASAGLTAGNSVLTVLTSSNSATHNLPVMVDVGLQLQSIALSTPVSLSVPPGGSAIFDAITYGVGGYQGPVNIQVSGLPAGITATPSSFTVSLSPVGIGSGEVKLTGASSLGNGTAPFTVTATAGTQTQQNAVVLTTAPTNVVAATVNPVAPGPVFPPYFIGFSLPQVTLEELAGTGATTYPSFINLLANLQQYVGSPSIRTGLPTGTAAVLGPLTNAATFTANGVTTKPSYILGTSATYNPGQAASELAQAIAAVGSFQIQGVELDNEPDLYVRNGYRPTNWTYTDFLTETSGYQATMAPYLTQPQLVVSAESGRTWDPGIPALMTQLSGQISTFTAHLYALEACDTTPTIPQLMEDLSTARYFSRYGALVKTLSPVPVRVGEVNTVACGGFAGVSDTMAAALWVVDMAFEAKAGGAAGFNLHSNGTITGGPLPYDIAYSNNGSLTVHAPFYGVLFLAQAIQNGASPLPVAITQTTGNVKVWATVDAAGTLRVAVLEKDLDGRAQSKTVVLDLGSYGKPGTLTTLTAPSLSATSGITIGGQTFDGTSDGQLTGPTVSTQVTPVNGVYTITVNDGTAAMLTVAR